MVLDMANSDVSSATVRVLVSFYLAAISYHDNGHIVLVHHTEVQKAISFLQKPSKTHVNSKCQSKGPIYISHLLAFVEIRLFNVFFWERKTGFWIVMKKVQDA